MVTSHWRNLDKTIIKANSLLNNVANEKRCVAIGYPGPENHSKRKIDIELKKEKNYSLTHKIHFYFINGDKSILTNQLKLKFISNLRKFLKCFFPYNNW